MLTVICGEIESSERQVLDWLAAVDLPGVAYANLHVPGRHGIARQADIVVWLPSGCVVVEVKGFTTSLDGTLRCWLNSAWTVDDAPAPLYGSPNPYDQLREVVFAVKNAVGGGFVAGVVVVLARGRVRLSAPQRPQGLGVLLGHPRDLLRWLGEQTADRPIVWTIAAVRRALLGLQVDPATVPSEQALAAAGFPRAGASAPLLGTRCRRSLRPHRSPRPRWHWRGARRRWSRRATQAAVWAATLTMAWILVWALHGTGQDRSPRPPAPPHPSVGCLRSDLTRC